jgi:hypothetical protein
VFGHDVCKPFPVGPEYAVNIMINNTHIDHVQGDNGKVIIFYLIILIYGMDKKGKVKLHRQSRWLRESPWKGLLLLNHP